MRQRTVGRLCQTPVCARGAHAPRVLAITPPRSRTFPEKPVLAGLQNQRARARALPRRNRAFTLIELLVVIAIIAVLIGLLFPAFRAVQDQAKRTQAKNDLAQIVNAINAYYTEYGKYPLPTTATSDYTYGPGGAANEDVFYALRAIAGGNINGGDAANPRKIVFTNPPYVKDPANPRGGIGTTTGPGRYYDPWGRPYNVRIDGDYNNQILNNPYDGNTGAGPSPLAIGVIAWSGGKDGKAPPDAGATTTFTDSDDVISWQ